MLNFYSVHCSKQLCLLLHFNHKKYIVLLCHIFWVQPRWHIFSQKKKKILKLWHAGSDIIWAYSTEWWKVNTFISLFLFLIIPNFTHILVLTTIQPFYQIILRINHTIFFYGKCKLSIATKIWPQTSYLRVNLQPKSNKNVFNIYC